MVYEVSEALRHKPKQSRGQRKVEHILRSAEALFAEVGFEHATTNAIASHAGVSIGSLYQFFASKDTILEAMAERYLNQTREVIAAALDAPGELHVDVLLDNLLKTLIRLQEQRPYFLQCLGTSRPSPVLAPAVEELNRSIASQVVRVFERGTIERDPVVLALRARICVETMSALLPLAVRARGLKRGQVVREIKQLLIRYIEPTLKVKGVL